MSSMQLRKRNLVKREREEKSEDDEPLSPRPKKTKKVKAQKKKTLPKRTAKETTMPARKDHGDASDPHSAFCSQPTHWKGKAGQSVGNASLEAFVNCFPEEKETCILTYPDRLANSLALFREAIQKSLRFNCPDCFVALCRKRGEHHKLHSARKDLEHAYTCVAAERPHFIATICEKVKNEKAASNFDWVDLGLLMNALLRAKNRPVLPHHSHVILEEQEHVSWFMLEQVEECVVLFIADDSCRPDVAALVDLCVQTCKGIDKRELVRQVRDRLERESWSSSVVSRAKQCCVDNGHANLAFVLAFVCKDWDLVETATSMSSLDLGSETLVPFLYMVNKPEEQGGSFSAGAAILSAYPITKELCSFDYELYELNNTVGLSGACEKRGLWDYALLIRNKKVAYVLKHYRRCQNRFVLERILELHLDVNKDRRWFHLALALCDGSAELNIFRDFLHKAVNCVKMDMVKALLDRIDPSACILNSFNDSLLFSAVVSCFSKAQKTEMVRLLLAAGLSSVCRDMVGIEGKAHLFQVCRFRDDCSVELGRLFHTFRSNCPLRCSFTYNLPDLVDLTLECGAYSHKQLVAVANDVEVERKAEESEDLKRCYERVKEAAHTPTPLQQLARLAVSRSVGCQPGRAERIDQLPVPRRLKDLVNFKDVLDQKT